MIFVLKLFNYKNGGGGGILYITPVHRASPDFVQLVLRILQLNIYIQC